MNLLIGANGAGKSNFISLFRMLAELFEQRLQLFVQEQDGPDALLFGTRKRTEQLEAELYFGRNGYRFALVPAGTWRIYHFHDTSTSSPIRQAQAVRDNLRLKADAGNLAAFLRHLR